MANKKQLDLIKKGPRAWNAWRNNKAKFNADLIDADLTHADLSGADLSGAILGGADLSHTDLSEANLSKANLSEVNLSEADLSGVVLSVANLTGSNLSYANLSGAVLTGAVLNGADLNHAILSSAVINWADLRGAVLTAADLSWADLSWAQLNNAVLHDAVLREAILTGANLSSADLRRADLIAANFTRAQVGAADFSEASVFDTVFVDIDLRNAIGLDDILHRAPSRIGIDTLFKSNGEIPQEFLEDAGVPEALIIQLPSIIASIQPIQFHSCFISYSHQDEQFSKRLHSRLRDEKLRVWYAPEDMKGGRKLHEEIFQAIQLHDKLLLVLSESSMKSEWVMTEIRRARKDEREENRRKLFPIRLVDFETIQNWECFDADSGKDLAVELREYYIPDFSSWKNHDAFEKEFAKLLRDLKASAIIQNH